MLLLIDTPTHSAQRPPWNRGRRVVPKPPLKLQQIWAIQIRADLEHRVREPAMFNPAIDSRLRGCDLVPPKVGDLMDGCHAVSGATLGQQEPRQPVRFELTEQTHDAIEAWIEERSLGAGKC